MLAVRMKTQILIAGKISSQIRSRQCNREMAGFTLIELIVVSLLISLSLSLIVGVNFKQRDSLVVRSTARQLYSYLLTARSQAILHNQSNCCWYDPTKNEIVTEIRKRVITIPDAVTVLREPEGVLSDKYDEKIALVYYYSDGSASAGKFCLKAGERSVLLTVDPMMGFVEISPGCQSAENDSEL